MFRLVLLACLSPNVPCRVVGCGATSAAAAQLMRSRLQQRLAIDAALASAAIHS